MEVYSCKKCGSDVDTGSAFCSKCRGKEILKNGLIVFACVLGGSIVSALFQTNGIILGAIPTILIYLPTFIAIGYARKRFRRD